MNLSTNLAYAKNDKGVELRVYSKDLGKHFKKEFGHGAENKRVPEFVFNLSKEQQRMVLSGLECSDGYFRNKYQEYSTVSESLAAGVFRICLLYTSPSPRDRQKSRMPSSA